MNLLTKTKAELLKMTVPERECYNIGELFPTIFDCEGAYNNGILKAKFLHLGNFEIKNNNLPKIKCPVCGKEEALIPYFCGASVLSGSHVIKFYCDECGEHIATNDNKDYFQTIKDFVLNKHKTNKNYTTTVI